MTTPPPRDDAIIRLLRERDGVASEVALRDGTALTVFDIAWGYDMGEEYAHVTTNISPGVEGASIDVFSTESVVAIIDPETRAVLLSIPGDANGE